MGRRGRGVEGGGKGSQERLNAMAYNKVHVDGQWGLFRHGGEMRLITCKASLASIELPA